MVTEKADSDAGIPSTNIPPPSTYDDKWWNELLSDSGVSSLIPEPQPVSVSLDHMFSHGPLASDLESTVHSNPRTHSYFCFRRAGNV